jgi:cell division protein FtsN
MTKPRRYRLNQLRVGVALTILLSGAVVGQAQETQREGANAKPPKAAWRWTLEERLAARFDPARMKARAAEEAVERKKAEKIFGERLDAAENQHSIDGRKEGQVRGPA